MHGDILYFIVLQQYFTISSFVIYLYSSFHLQIKLSYKPFINCLYTYYKIWIRGHNSKRKEKKYCAKFDMFVSCALAVLVCFSFSCPITDPFPAHNDIYQVNTVNLVCLPFDRLRPQVISYFPFTFFIKTFVSRATIIRQIWQVCVCVG